MIGKTVNEIYRISVNEDGCEYEPDDSFVFKTSDETMIQLVIDYEIYLYPIQSIDDIIILGEYNRDAITSKLVLVSDLKPNGIAALYNYYQGDHYHFGTQFRDAADQFIFGLCFGFDEVILLNQNEFNIMLSNYKNHTKIKI